LKHWSGYDNQYIYRARGDKMYNRILVPLDGSELAECALPHVINLIKQGSAEEVIVLNVVGVDIPWDEMDRGVDSYALRQKLLVASKKYIENIASKLSSEGIKVKAESIEHNRPAHTIVDYANQNSVDLIVMATHGYAGIQKMLLGSVAFKVLNESHVPVLLIRP
jgi:nucleotide-binding universal stress UspA family protein